MASITEFQPVYTPPVEEEVVPAGAPAQTYTEPAPAPVQQYSGGGAAEIQPAPVDYTAAPAEAPQEFIPGSTYRPVSIEEEQKSIQQAPPPPAPTVNDLPAQSGIVTDPFSGLGDVGGTLRDNIARGNVKDTLTTLADIPGMFWQNEENFIAQRAKDAAIHGDPDYTTGDIGPGSILQHPENIGHALPVWTSEFDQMPDWVPSSTKQQTIEYYQDPANAEALAEAQEREKTEGVQAYYNVWNENMGNTLDTGGVWGLVRGGIRQSSEPVSLLSGAISGAGSTTGQILKNADQIGMARGVSAITRGQEVGMDPLMEGATYIGGKLIGGVFGKSAATQGKIKGEVATEAINSAVGAFGRQVDPNAILGPQYTPPDPTLHGPEMPPGYPLGGAVEGPGAIMYPQGVNNPSSPIEGPPAPRGYPLDWNSPIGPGIAQDVTNARAARNLGRQASQPADVSPDPYNPDRTTNGGWVYNNKQIVRNPDNSIRWADGSEITKSDMDSALLTMMKVGPNEWHPAQYQTLGSQHSLMRAAMTQNGYMWDDWSPARVQRSIDAGHDSAYISKGRAAGEKHIRLQEVRFREAQKRGWGDTELQRVVDGAQTKIYNMAIANNGNMSYLAARQVFESVEEAARRANIQTPFEMEYAGIKFEYKPANSVGTKLTPRRAGNIVPQGYFDAMYANDFVGQKALYDAGQAGTAEFHGFERVAPISPRMTNYLRELGVPDNEETPHGLIDMMVRDPQGFIGREEFNQKAGSNQLTPSRATQLNDYITLQARMYKKAKTRGLPALLRKEWELYNKQFNATPAPPEMPVDAAEMLGKLNQLENAIRGPEAIEAMRAKMRAPKLNGPRTAELTDWELENGPTLAHPSEVPPGPAKEASIRAYMEYASHMQVLHDELRSILDKMGLKSTNFNFDDHMEPGVGGLYFTQHDFIALSSVVRAGDLRELPAAHFKRVLRHEAVHAFRAMGIIQESEWGVLVAAAKKHSNPQSKTGETFFKDAQMRYNRQALEGAGRTYNSQNAYKMWEEEAVAELFAYYHAGGDLAHTPKIRNIIGQILDRIHVLGMMLRGMDPNAAKIMDDMANGAYANRPRIPTKARRSYKLLDGEADAPNINDPDFIGPRGMLEGPEDITRYGPKPPADIQARLDAERRAIDPWGNSRVDPVDPTATTPRVRPRIVPDSANDPFKDVRVTAEKYPHLFAKMEDAAVQQGKPSLASTIKDTRKTGSTKLRAMSDRETTVSGEYDNAAIPDGMKLVLNHMDEKYPLEVDGAPMRIWDYVKQVSEETEAFVDMVRKVDPNDPKANKVLAKIRKKYEGELGKPGEPGALKLEDLTDAERRELVATHISAKWIAQHVPPQAPGRSGLLGDFGRMMKDIVDFRRSVGLTNFAAAPRQFLNQLLGNTYGLFMGKPSALLDLRQMKDLKTYINQINADPNARNTQLQNVFQYIGQDAPNTMISSGGRRTLAGHEIEISSDALGKLRDIAAPKVIRGAVAGPDELAKGMVANATIRPLLRKEIDGLPTNAKRTAAKWSLKRPGLEVVAARIEKDLPARLANYKRKEFNRPLFTGEELQREILDMFKDDVRRGTVNRQSLIDYADRMGRDWNTVTNSIKQDAAAETKRVMFSWDNTKADDFIQNIFLYHYWATRAGYLYTKEMIKKPYILNFYMDAAEQMQMEAEKGDYPNWLKGWTRVMNSPSGVALFMSPLDMIGTAFHLNELEMGATDAGNETLTALGQAKGMIPFVWNPAVELVLSFAGAFGPGASMPNNMLGLNRATTLVADVLNWANYEGMLGDLAKDANGHPIYIPPRPLDDIILKVAGHFGMPVVPSTASFEKETHAYLYENILAEYGDMDLASLNAMASEMYERAKTGDVDPLLYDAQAEAAANGMKGPEYSFLPEGLRQVVGAVQRYVSPVRMSARSEMGALIQYPGMSNVLPSGNKSIVETLAPLGGDEFDQKNNRNAMFQTPRRMAMDVAYNEYYDGGNPELAELSDTYYDIGGNRMGAPVVAGGVEYSLADMNAMSDKQRYDVAEQWLLDQGYQKSDLRAMEEYKDQIIAENPDVGGYIAYQRYVDNYPGGPAAFAAEAMKTSPSFAAYMAGQGDPSSPDYFDYVGTKDAYFAISGEQSGIYDQANVPDQGYIPGLPMGTNFITKYQTDKQVEDALSDEKGEGFQKLVSDVTTSVNAIYAAQEWLNVNYPGVRADGDIDYNVYKAMKAAGVTAPKAEDAALAYEYYNWLEQNPTATDFSVEAFIDNRESTGGGTSWSDLPDATPEMIEQQRNLNLTQSAPVSTQDLQNIGIMGTLSQYSPLYYGPTDTSSITFELGAGAPVKEIYRGNDGWSQVYVPKVGGGQVIGWVPTASIAAS